MVCDGRDPSCPVPFDSGLPEAVSDFGESVQGVVLHLHGGPVCMEDALGLSCHSVGGGGPVAVPVFFPDGTPEGIVAEVLFPAEGVCGAQYHAEGVSFVDRGMVFSAVLPFPADGSEIVKRIVSILCGVPHGVRYGSKFPAHGISIAGDISFCVGCADRAVQGIIGIGHGCHDFDVCGSILYIFSCLCAQEVACGVVGIFLHRLPFLNASSMEKSL